MTSPYRAPIAHRDVKPPKAPWWRVAVAVVTRRLHRRLRARTARLAHNQWWTEHLADGHLCGILDYRDREHWGLARWPDRQDRIDPRTLEVVDGAKDLADYVAEMDAPRVSP